MKDVREAKLFKKANLEGYRFSGFHRSHIGAIKSCLEYFNAVYSPAWIYGMTGSAFMTIIDDRLSAPNIGEPEQEIFGLARHLGLDIQGYHTFADIGEFTRLQREAWEAARSALDRGKPVFAKELDLGNETSLIYAYDDVGYYTYSWHGGHGHEGSDDVIPWTKLGRNYCPCVSCKSRIERGEWSSDAVYIGKPEDGGFISLHWASLIEPSDDLTALRSALDLVLDFFGRNTYEWGGRKFHSGLAAYDRWIEALRTNSVLGFYMGYYSDIYHEGRHYAHLFLKEAAGRFEGTLSEVLYHTADHYKRIQEAFRSLTALFPWSQPHSPIEDPDRRREAMEALIAIKKLEQEGNVKLAKLRDICGP